MKPRATGGRRWSRSLMIVAFLAAGACSSAAPERPEPLLDRFTRDTEYGRAAFDRGDIEVAAAQYERALARARAMDDPSQVSAAANNLGAIRLMQHRASDACALLTESVAASKASGSDPSGPEFLLATAARADGAPDEAAAILDGLLDRGTPAPLAIQCRLLSGHLAADRGDADSARTALTLAETAGLDDAGPLVRARAAELAGRIADMHGNPAAAASAYDRELALLRAAGAATDLPAALSRSGGAHHRSGDDGAAADRYWRAARSAFAQGDRDSASAAAAQARTLAAASGSTNIATLVDALVREMSDQAKAGDGRR